MDREIEAKINKYLMDETQLYQDWYVGLTQTEEVQYTKPVGVIPPLSELKKMCEDWIDRQAPVFKEKLREPYRENKQHFPQQESLLIALVADILNMTFTKKSMNVVTVAVILVTTKCLDYWCVAGKAIEELTVAELKAIASEAGRKAYENARHHGFRVTTLREGQIMWLYPDGHVEPIADT